ncbi:MAG: hypothetical protein J3K34DRAFT_79905 [Monoraphidium minutum]|nr:MAG: hypothetical protein J3K34DRAFT_79905 [Monoraphidium minutum]
MAAPATLGDVINMEYTRGGPGDTDNRGATLVERHNERMQEERENTALEKLSALMPTLGSKLRAFALAKSEWDVDGALALLRSFQVAELDRLNAISKKRKRIAEEADEAAEGGPAAKAGGGGGASSGGGGGSSSSESGSGSESSGSDSDGSRRKRKRGGDKEKRKKGGKDKKRKRKGKDKEKSKSRKDKGKRKEREEERRGKEKRAKRRRSSEEPDAKAKAHSSDFGKFGVIREADSDRKRSEFLAWALDVKKVDVEALARWEEKEMFKEFVEDFNTGTLPHK